MDITNYLIETGSQMSATKTAYEASIKVARKALDVQEQTGQNVMKLLETGDMNRATEGAATGSNIDFLA
ncbi:MAG: hypothetical protein C0603_06670 [Denitrovibrio sp.]|nr:MAG: hypothetical protein C0603_06670 [Denitrovibrio sp.]